MALKGSVRSMFMHADAVDKLLMAVGFIGAMGDGLTMPAMNIVNSRLMNNMGAVSTVSAHKFQERINKSAVLLLYLACASFVLSFLGGYCWTRTGERQAARMRARYLKAVLRQDVGYFDLHATTTSEVITSVSNDSLIVQDALSEKVPNFVKQISLFVGSYITAFVLLWRLAIVGFPFIVLVVVPSFLYGRVLMQLMRNTREEYNKAGTVVEQAISSIRIVYSFVGEAKVGTQFSKALEKSVKLGLRLGLAKGLTIGSSAVTFAIYAFMTYYGSRMVMYHGAQGGTVFIVALSIVVGGSALGYELSNLKYIAEACSAAERIMEMINRIPVIDSENLKGEILESVSGEVEFRNVKFAYPSRPETLVFREFCLKVPGGRTVALVGASGSGKSTVVSLLQRFYDPVDGEILLDGVGIQRLQLRWLRSQMGLVSQEPALFATTIKENILFGKEDGSMEQVMEAAKASSAHDFITQLPQGYDTQVGEHGVQISGGQKQRIAIARAIIKSPKILLLDEATSALDSESERAVQEALDQATIGRTSIVIAHRLSTIRNAHIIVVVQDGQVMETGSHNELTQYEDGLYTSLVRLQQIEQDNAAQDNKDDDTVPSTSIHNSTATNNNSSNRWREVPPQSTTTLDGEVSSVAVGTKAMKKPPRPSFRRLIALSLPEWKQASVGCISAILQGVVQPLYSFAMGGMVSVYFLTSHDAIKAKTRMYCLSFIGLAVFMFVNYTVQHYNFAYMAEYLTNRIRLQMMSKILTFEIGWFDQDKNSTGAVCSRLAKDAYAVRSLISDRVSLLIQTVTTIIVAWTMGLVISWRLALLMIAVQPLVVGCYYTRKVILKVMSEKALKAQELSSNLASEAVSNLRTITAFSSQQRFLQMLEKAQEGPRREAIRQSWYAGLGLGISQSLTCLLWALDFWYGSKLVAARYITAKDMFQTFMILFSTGRVIANAGGITSDLAKASEAIDSVFSVLDRSSQINPNDPEGHRPENIVGQVEFLDVEFSYPERPDAVIFKDFSITIEAGKSTALVGHSGSGKSTVIALIERFYDPIHGVVKIDGRDIKSYNLRSLREHIALVSQEPALFSTTIKENIAYGATREVSESEIMKAAEAANVHEFISSLKDGYETSCGDRGVQLSGGQKQRIAIARAILKNPGLLLLDEATSALDGHSEKVVQEALERVMVGRTSVVVAHRLSTIQKCDEIVVMDKGKVLEKGSHTALMAKAPEGAYYSLVTLQRTQIS